MSTGIVDSTGMKPWLLTCWEREDVRSTMDRASPPPHAVASGWPRRGPQSALGETPRTPPGVRRRCARRPTTAAPGSGTILDVAMKARPALSSSRRPHRSEPRLEHRKGPGPPARGLFHDSGGGERREEILARPLAAPALFRGEAAVLVVVGVALALLGTRAARRHAGLQRRPLGRCVGIGLAADDAQGAAAGVRAVVAEADAAHQRADVVLGLARVRADRAACLAGAALVDAPHEHGQVGDGWPGVGLENLFDAHGLSFGCLREDR